MTPSAPSASPVRAVLTAFLVLSPTVFWYGLVEPFEPCKVALTQLAALAIIVLAIAGGGWRRLPELFAGPVGLAVAAGVGVACVSTALSICPGTSLRGSTDSHDGLGHALALAVLFAASRAVRLRGESLAVAGVGLGLACSYALVQAAGLDPVAWETSTGFAAWNRPVGTMGHPCYLAGYAVMVLPLLVWGMAEGGSRAHAAALLAAIAVLVVVLTLARAAWLAGGAAALTLALLWPGQPGWRRAVRAGQVLAAVAVLVGIACVVLGSQFAGSLLDRLSGFAASPGRWPIWQGGWQVFLDNPWLGSGPDTFGLAFTAVRTPAYWAIEWGVLPRRAHCDLLHALATQGLAGGLAYLGLAVALVIALTRAWRARPDERRLIAALASIVVAFYAQNLVCFAVAGTAALFAVVVGVIAGLADGQAEPVVPGRESLLAAALGVVVIAGSLAQGHDETAVWRVLLAGVTAAVAAGVGLATCCRAAVDPGRGMLPVRQLVLPGLIAVLASWLIVSPLLAAAASRQGDLDLAGHDWAVRLAPWHDLFHFRRAVAYLATAERDGRPELLAEAQRSIDSACGLAPRCAAHHANRGRVLFERVRVGGSADGVLAAFDESLRLDPCDPLVWCDAGRSAAGLGRLNEADRYVARGLEIAPGLGALHAERGAVLMMRAEWTRPPDGRLLAQAEAVLEASLSKQWHGEVEREGRARLILVLAHLQRHDFRRALRRASEGLERQPGSLAAQWLRAAALEGLGQQQAALAAYQVVLRRQPDNPHAKAGVARLTKPR